MVFVFGSHLTMILPTSKFHLFATAATLGNGHDENGGRHGPYRGRVRQGRSREQSVVRGGAQRAALPPSMVLLVIKSVFCFFSPYRSSIWICSSQGMPSMTVPACVSTSHSICPTRLQRMSPCDGGGRRWLISYLNWGHVCAAPFLVLTINK